MPAELCTEITDFARGVIGRPAKDDELIGEITRMAAVNPSWPRATWSEWEAAIESAIVRGLLVRIGKEVWLPPPTPAEPQPKQMDLFE